MSVPILYAGSNYKPGVFVPIPVPVAPQFASAEVGNVNASTVAVTFDSDVVADGSDYSSGVAIKVNGSTRAFESGIRQTNHAVVYYALSLAVANGDTVTWEYSGGIITGELYGLALADVTAQNVTNNVAPSGPTALLDLRSDTGVTTSTAAYDGTGTITQSGTTISGTGTLFQLEIVVGDQIAGSGISGIVQSITSDTELELDTTASVGVGVVYTITPQANTARVTEWANQGTLGGSLTQSSAVARPALQTISGTKYVRLNGFSDWMLGDAGWSTPLNNPDTLTVYFVLKSTLTTGHHIDVLTKIFDPSSDAGWEFDEMSGFTQDAGANNYAYRGADKQFDGTAVHLIRFDVTRTTASFIVNGFTQNQSGTSSGTVADMSNDQPVRLGIMGVGTNPIDEWFYSTPFSVLRMLIYSPALSVEDNATILAQLMSDYSIPAPVEPAFVSGAVVDANTVDIVFSTDMYSVSTPSVIINIKGSSTALVSVQRFAPNTLRFVTFDSIQSGDAVTWEFAYFNASSALVSADVGWLLADVSEQTVVNGL